MPAADFHTHTVFSDGKNTPEELVRSAVQAGFSAIGISDHAFTPHDLSYCMKKEDLPRYFFELGELKERFAGLVEVYAGIEKDALSEIDPAQFDFVIGSVHYVSDGERFFEADGRAGQQKFLAEAGDRTEFARRYFDAVVRHAATRSFCIQGHFDVIAKYGLYDGEDPRYRAIALEALDAVLENVPFLEINTGAVARGLRAKPYPDEFLIRRAVEKGARFVLSSDAHRAEHLGFAFPEAAALLFACGARFAWRLSRGVWTEEALPGSRSER